MLEIFPHETIREVRLCRPPVNALDPGLIQALTEAVGQACADGAQGIVISGREGMFSAGLDVPALLALDESAMRAAWGNFFAMLETVARSPIPIISAITGHSPAGGAVLSLYTDYRIMADGKFQIGLNETQVGLPLPPVIYQALRYAVGARQAERLGVSGALISPHEALRVGLVDEVVPLQDVIGRAVAVAQHLCRLPQSAAKETRALARADLIATFDTWNDEQLSRWTDIWFSDDTQAALEALVARIGR